ncbi:hypothetical protein [Paenibacillus sp. ALJ109b]
MMTQNNINPSTPEDSEYVRQQLIAFNAAHVSEEKASLRRTEFQYQK